LEQGGPVLKNDLLKLVRWFCLKLTYNDLASVVPILQELLTGSRKDLDLKPVRVSSTTTLFVAYYNFMRPHGSLKKRPPVELECLKDNPLHPDQWVELLRQAA